jgi:hypothetical protein
VLLFARNRLGLETLGEPFFHAARDDRLAWLAYPKAGQLDTNLSRDVLRELTRPQGVRPVRQVSIDQVWSALRFRPAQSRAVASGGDRRNPPSGTVGA